MLIDTLCYVTSATFTISGLTDLGAVNGDYTIPSTILAVDEMYITSGGTQEQLERTDDINIIEMRRSGVPVGTPTRYYATKGSSLLMLYPTPSDTDVLTIYHVPVPTDMSSAGHDSSAVTYGGIPTQLDEAIFFYACSRLASYDDDQTSAQGQRYRDWYKEEIERYHKLIRRKGGSRNARAVVNEKRRIRAYHDNSIYPRY